MIENQPDRVPDKVTESIDYVFKMRRDGRMDEEEACFAVGAILSGGLSEKDLEIFRLMYLFRKKDGSAGPASLNDEPEKSDPGDPGVTIMIRIK